MDKTVKEIENLWTITERTNRREYFWTDEGVTINRRESNYLASKYYYMRKGGFV